tara:strand:- start:1961 stop:3301 length:1341 start_codon:yes stop_codon:yes gene_type:complete
VKSRRKFIKSSLLGLTAVAFPNIIKVSASQDYDVVVVGAGAAGLAATNEFRKQGGKSVLCLEASNRIGGRVWTDNNIFGKPYDKGALWIENGDSSPFIKFAEKNSKLTVYKERRSSQEIYSVYDGNKTAKNENELWRIYDTAQASIASTRKDISPIEVVPNQDSPWFNTAHMLVGPWEMGKDFSDYSCKDYNFEYDVITSGTYHCEQGYGALFNEMYKDVPVELNTKVKEIDWSGKGVKIITDKGTILSNKCIITVSNGVLSSEKIKFTPKLNVEKQEAFSKISLGHYNRVALEFKKLFSKKAHDSYLYYKVKSDSMGSPKGCGITINPSKSELCFCDFGGKFGLEVSKEGSEAAIDFALNELVNAYGSKIKKDLVNSHFADWSSNVFIKGAWASAEPGAFKYREILKEPIADKIYFAGEACARDWGTVGGATESGILQAKNITKS